MKTAYFRFYEELNDFLPKKQKKMTYEFSFLGSPSVFQAIQEIGILHTEVDLIIVNGLSVNFSYRLKDKDRIAVYPVFEAIDISTINRLRPKPLRHVKFILDIHLGRLAKYLRICGFDCFYENLDDPQIIDISRKENRIILTKDKGLLKDKAVTHGYWIRAKDPKKQLVEVVERFDLIGKVQFLIRCLRCNEKLRRLPKNEVINQVSAKTRQYYQQFYFCKKCNKIYWEGSHYQNMSFLIKFVTDSILT